MFKLRSYLKKHGICDGRCHFPSYYNNLSMVWRHWCSIININMASVDESSDEEGGAVGRGVQPYRFEPRRSGQEEQPSDAGNLIFGYYHIMHMQCGVRSPCHECHLDRNGSKCPGLSRFPKQNARDEPSSPSPIPPLPFPSPALSVTSPSFPSLRRRTP